MSWDRVEKLKIKVSENETPANSQIIILFPSFGFILWLAIKSKIEFL